MSMETKTEDAASLDIMDDSRVISLVCVSDLGDGKSPVETGRINVPAKYAFMSDLVKCAMTNDEKATEMPLPNVTFPVLKLVVEYMEHHKGIFPPAIECPLRSKLMKDVCKDKWDAEFIERFGDDMAQVYALIMAANYMDIKGLLNLSCAKIGSVLKNEPLQNVQDKLRNGSKVTSDMVVHVESEVSPLSEPAKEPSGEDVEMKH